VTWTRTKRWIGEHPVRAIIIGLTPWAVPFFSLLGVLFSMASASVPPRLSGPAFVPLAALAWLACTPFVLVGVSCFVGCVLGRAGLRVERAWNAPLWMCGIMAGVFLLFLLPLLLMNGEVQLLLLLPLGAVAFGLLSAVPLAIGNMTGLRLAEWITRWMIRRGRWEVTRPVVDARTPTETEEVERSVGAEEAP